MGFSGVSEAAVPCSRHQRVELLAREVHEAFMVAGFEPDLRRPVEPIIDDRFDTIAGLEFKHNKAGVSLVDSRGAGTPRSESPSYATHAGPKPKSIVL
jgi:hypothetical protein